jgi:ADP-heptose:LPS heptosyltransferase
VRILLLCLDNLGDLVFSSSLVTLLSKTHEDASWAIFCKDYAEDIAHAFPSPAKVIAADPPWDGSPGAGKGSYLKFFRALRRARQWRPDVILVASKNWRAAATARLIGGKIRIGFDTPKAKRFLTNPVSRDQWQETPVTSMLARLLSPLGINSVADAPPLVSLKVPNASYDTTSIPEKPYVMLHPFAGDLKRCWPLKQWVELAKKIRAAGYVVVWLGRSDEAGIIHNTCPDTSGDEFMWQIGKDKLAATLAVTARSVCLVGHDSGPIHFAAALGVPVLGLYLPSEFPRTVSSGVAAQRILCRKSPEDLGFDDVWQSLNELL